MAHVTIKQILERVERAKSDSDYTMFFALLFAGEALLKTIALGITAAISDDTDRNRYRLEYQLVHSDGLGDWGKVIEDALTGPASQYLLTDAREEQRELIQLCKEGDWQYDAVAALKKAIDSLEIDSEDLPVKTDMKRWFRLFTTLRNKTRGHGATQPAKAATAAKNISQSIELVYTNFRLFKRPWAHLHRNLSGKYRVSPITDNASDFDFLKQTQDHHYRNGVYLFMGHLDQSH